MDSTDEVVSLCVSLPAIKQETELSDLEVSPKVAVEDERVRDASNDGERSPI